MLGRLGRKAESDAMYADLLAYWRRTAEPGVAAALRRRLANLEAAGRTVDASALRSALAKPAATSPPLPAADRVATR